MGSKHPDQEGRRSKVSRRGFLGGLGAAGAAGAAGVAGGVALAPQQAGARVLDAEAIQAAINASANFGRIFQLPPFADAGDPRVLAALRELGQPGGLLDADDPLEAGPVDLITDPALRVNNRDNEFHTAGTTFFGQFCDHDLTFDTTSRLGVPKPPEESPNARTPALDLDSVYGGGPVSSPQLYDPADRDKLKIESGGLHEDLPRMSDGTAIIGDPRNDENMMVAGFHAATILFHNNAVDFARSEGVPADQVFEEARRLTRWHFQWVVIHEFLYQVCGFPTIDHIMAFGRQFYRPTPGQQAMPVEFQGACYRFGHSMVRPSYRTNRTGDNGGPFFGFIFDPAAEGQDDPSDLRGGARAPRRFIGWDTFFDFRNGEIKRNKRIDTSISTPLFQLPLQTIPDGQPPISLATRNLLRQLTWSLPSGQAIATAMGIPTLGPTEFPELRQFGVGFERSTPLWYYTLKEAELIRDGISLGPMGARIVGEVFIGLMQLDPTAYLNVDPDWTPTLPGGAGFGSQFEIVDFLNFAGVGINDRI